MIAARRAAEPKLNARAGKKEEGWGEGIFARPRFRRFFFRRRNFSCQQNWRAASAYLIKTLCFCHYLCDLIFYFNDFIFIIPQNFWDFNFFDNFCW